MLIQTATIKLAPTPVAKHDLVLFGRVELPYPHVLVTTFEAIEGAGAGELFEPGGLDQEHPSAACRQVRLGMGHQLGADALLMPIWGHGDQEQINVPFVIRSGA
jgi:hypothetical protein